MKTLLTALLLVATSLLPSWAQRTVAAKEILDKINRRETVSYENTIITGDLDLTELANKKRVSNNRWAETEAYESTVETPVTFRNCTFKGAFLAYKNPEPIRLKGNGILYATHFNEAVTFENCTFERESEFKYSDFKQRAVYTGSSFRKEANFKYAKFRAAVDFSDVRFGALANFKYTAFKEDIAFRKARFEEYADFKYTKFNEGASFQNSRFNGMADFKYTHLPRTSSFEDTVFSGPSDFKYATLEGRKFSPARR
ncbi:pentapeptide repeat protein [Larkinella arboricola]|uniref:Pentapeptide repeat protein n=1 Tax=Larkinella arboricola TaxID=643671 RepID=A0A327XA94_LARAB|nr:pentapeptide repeat-containing protein [Larkinella arboricola]RAK02542.1 pentapeptide repeat protein [Larkinella arboricola]